MIVVWDTETAQPPVTIPKPHSNGTLAMDLSLDGTMLVTLSNPEDEEGLQEIALWDLASVETSTSTIRIPIPAGDIQVRLLVLLVAILIRFLCSEHYVGDCKHERSQ
jgi:hypothetical protein